MRFEALEYISVHKSLFPLRSIQQMEGRPPSDKLHDLVAIRGYRLRGQWGALN